MIEWSHIGFEIHPDRCRRLLMHLLGMIGVELYETLAVGWVSLGLLLEGSVELDGIALGCPR